MLKWPSSAAAMFLSAALIAVGGCGSYVERGSTLYHEGRYVQAAEVFERTEQRLPAAPPSECAEYGLYRGLTLLALGDLRNSHRWLTYAYEMERSGAGSLKAHERAMLDQGWNELNRQLMQATESSIQPSNNAVAGQPGTQFPMNGSPGTAPVMRSFAQ